MTKKLEPSKSKFRQPDKDPLAECTRQLLVSHNFITEHREVLGAHAGPVYVTKILDGISYALSCTVKKDD